MVTRMTPATEEECNKVESILVIIMKLGGEQMHGKTRHPCVMLEFLGQRPSHPQVFNEIRDARI
jgi:hypothetical protein